MFTPESLRSHQMQDERDIFDLLAECNALRKKIIEKAMGWNPTPLAEGFRVASDHIGIAATVLEDGALGEIRKYYATKIAEAKKEKENES